MLYVITYDIVEPKILRKVAKLLEESGIRSQNSVFEIECSARFVNALFKKIEKLIDPEKDKCFLVKISKKEDLCGKTSIDRIF
jgi:CRISPR-associated protein Cas2